MSELDLGARLIARMSGSRSQAAAGRGGQSISVPELGALLSSTDNLGGLLARRVYGLEYHVMPDLERASYVYISTLAADEGWRMPKGIMLLRRMTALALKEVIDPDKCPGCRGTAMEWDAKAHASKDCSVCGGTGQIRADEGMRADALKMNPDQYRKTWRTRYERIVTTLQGKMEDVTRKVARAYVGTEKERRYGREDRSWERQRIKRPPNCIYFMRAGDFVKVGVSRDVESRRAQIQTGNHHEVTVLAALKVDKPFALEKAIHKRLARIKTQGEWFAYGKEVLDLVEAALEGESELWFFATYPG